MHTLCFFIHGVGSQSQDYADGLKKGLDHELRKLISQRRKVNEPKWADLEPADIASYHVLYWANVGTDKQANLYRTLYPDFFAEKSRLKRIWNALVKFSPARSLALNLLGDVFGYLGQFQAAIKQEVFLQLVKPLEAAIAKEKPFSVILVGHSLGTVIIHDLLGAFLRYHYTAFDQMVGHTSVFTMGSPLSLFELVAESAAPSRFKRWVNFLHDRDPIAFPMSRVPGFKNVTDIRLHKFRWNPLVLHSTYWNHPKVHRCVAEEIIAHRENDAGVTPTPSSYGPIPPEIFQNLSGGASMAGLSQAFADFSDVPFKQLIQSANTIDFCNIYGGSWLQKNAQYFAKALEKPDVTIRACILAPDNPGLPGLSHHFEGKSVADIQKRIDDGTTELIKTVNEAKKHSSAIGKLKIYRSKNVVNHSFYRFDDMLYFAPRPLASSKYASTPIPCFAFRKTTHTGGAYEWIMRDFEELLKTAHDATLHFEST